MQRSINRKKDNGIRLLCHCPGAPGIFSVKFPQRVKQDFRGKQARQRRGVHLEKGPSHCSKFTGQSEALGVRSGALLSHLRVFNFFTPSGITATALCRAKCPLCFHKSSPCVHLFHHERQLFIVKCLSVSLPTPGAT